MRELLVFGGPGRHTGGVKAVDRSGVGGDRYGGVNGTAFLFVCFPPVTLFIGPSGAESWTFHGPSIRLSKWSFRRMAGLYDGNQC